MAAYRWRIEKAPNTAGHEQRIERFGGSKQYSHLPVDSEGGAEVSQWGSRRIACFAREDRRCMISGCLGLVVVPNVSLYHDCCGKQVAACMTENVARYLTRSLVALQSTTCHSHDGIVSLEKTTGERQIVRRPRCE